MTTRLILLGTAINPIERLPQRRNAVHTLRVLTETFTALASSVSDRSQSISALTGQRLASPKHVYEVCHLDSEVTNLIVYYYGYAESVPGDLLLYSFTSSRRKRSKISLCSMLSAARESNSRAQIAIIVDAEPSTKNVSVCERIEGPSAVLVRRARDYLSMVNGAELLTGTLASLLSRGLSILPSLSLEHLLTLVSKRTGHSFMEDFMLLGKADALRDIALCGNPSSRIWKLDPDNFGSKNNGSREDGLQALREAMEDSELRSDAEFLLQYFSEVDSAQNVRRGARALLVQTKRRVWMHPVGVSRKDLSRLVPKWIEIPAGEFWMGSDVRSDPDTLSEEIPQHRLFLDTFFIAKRQVSRFQFNLYRYATGLTGECPDASDDRFPCSGVNWYEALNYCRWLTEVATREGLIERDAKLTLPSEAEWEKAARGVNRRIYPWGNKFKLDRCNCREQGIGEIVEFGTFSPRGDSMYGVEDMAGNVWEWTRSNWGRGGRTPEYSYPYVVHDGRENLDAPADVRRVIRGGAFYYFDYCVRCATRNVMFPETRHSGGGFRVVKIPIRSSSSRII